MLSSIRRGFGGQAGATPPRKIAVRVRGGYDPETIRAEAGAKSRLRAPSRSPSRHSSKGAFAHPPAHRDPV